jgi:Skp family chaperone for outer membrane proteins
VNYTNRLLLWIPTLAALTACGGGQASSPIATVDVARISANWPKFINYQNQLSADADALEHANLSPAEKQREQSVLQQRYSDMQSEVTSDVRTAAEQVANERHFELVVTRAFVGYGGVDITPDVEKILKITEVSPPPSP